jgi:hypothetical protein
MALQVAASGAAAGPFQHWQTVNHPPASKAQRRSDPPPASSCATTSPNHSRAHVHVWPPACAGGPRRPGCLAAISATAIPSCCVKACLNDSSAIAGTAVPATAASRDGHVFLHPGKRRLKLEQGLKQQSRRTRARANPQMHCVPVARTCRAAWHHTPASHGSRPPRPSLGAPPA